MSPVDDVFSGTDRFSIVRRLGAGGMGVVYEAFDRERQERVALKTLREFDAAALYRFKHEFRALSAILHRHLIPLYELVGRDDQWFFTMELVENATDLLAFVRPDIGRETRPASTDPESTSRSTISGTTSVAAQWAQWAAVPRVDAESPPVDVDTLTHAATRAAPDGQDDQPTVMAEPDDIQDIEALASWAPLPPVTPAPAAPIDFDRLRDAFRQLADGVSALHAAGKLHRDLKPSNVLVTADRRVVILDFGLVAELGDRLETGGGRVPRAAASRSYQSTDRNLSGTLHFMSPEQASGAPLTPASDWYAFGVMLFQALTGRLPYAKTGAILEAKRQFDALRPSQIVAGVPPELDDLTAALMRRDPSERAGAEDVFGVLGAAEVSAAAVPAGADLFVGRSAHLAELTSAFADVQAGRAVVCHVSGRSGAGKSTLISRFLDTVPERTVVLSGKCYEQESVPYKALDSLVDALTRHLLGLPHASVAAIVPRHMPELARVFPVLARVDALAAGAGRAMESGDLRGVRRRAFEALRELLVALATIRLLVLYIDDLQWGDVDSAALLADLMRPPDAPGLLLLLSYRSEYLTTSGCLQALAAQLDANRSDRDERRIDVDALPADETRRLATALLGEDRSDREREADWVVRESGGRPFFIYELVEHLRRGAAAGTSPDLDKVLWQRVMRLPEVSRRLLEVVAVAGRPIRLLDAQAAAAVPSLSSQVVPGLRAGRFVQTTGPSLNDDIETFHDRIRASINGNLGVDLLRQHHAGLASALERSGRADAETLGAHFEGAGDTARAGRYYEQAANDAVQVLAFDRAETLFTRAAALTAEPADRARIHERLIHFYTDMARFADAYAIGRKAVEPFGIRLPTKFMPPMFAIDFIGARLRLRGMTPQDLLALRPAADARLETAVRLMNAVAKAAYQVRPELCVAVATKIVSLCLRHGNTRDCAIGYMVFGAIFHGGVLGNHRFGYDFGRLALDLVERYANEQQRAEVNFVVGYFGTSWLRPATDAEALWRTAYEAGLRTGDLFHTGCACAGTIMSYHMRGVPMDQVLAESDVLLDVLRRNRLREPIGVLTAVRQAIRNLRGQTRTATSLDDEAFDEQAFERELSTYGSRHFAHFYYIAKLQLLYLWGDYAAALEVAGRAAVYLEDSQGMLHGTDHEFYRALALAALGKSPRTVGQIARKFRKWAAACPHNFEHKALILVGEAARVSGQPDRAAALFALAEQAAAQYGYLHVQALAAQLGSRVLASSSPDAARQARGRAVDAYRAWGATAYASRMVNGTDGAVHTSRF